MGYNNWKAKKLPVSPFVSALMGNSRANNTVTMAPIPELELTLDVGWYRVEFVPHYNVNATTTGTGWNFQGGTAALSDFCFNAESSSSATAEYNNYYVSRSQNWTTAQTSRVNNNRAVIVADFQVTTAGTIIPYFRSEVAGGSVTLLPGSFMRAEKLG